MFRTTIRRLTRWALPALVLSVAAVACDETSSPTGAAGDGNGQLSVYLTDAPGDVDSAWVQIDDVQLMPSNQDEDPISLLDEPTGLINLVQLQDSATVLAEAQDVEPGSYTQVRFLLGSAVLQSSNGGVYTFGGADHPHGMESTGRLQCPGCRESGITVQLPGSVTIEEGEEVGVLLDFDVTQSFGRTAGRSGMWVMRPVIIGSVTSPASIEAGDTEGEITGTVALDTDVSIPACGVDENGDPVDRTLEEFIPVATANTLTDEDDEPLTFSGETSEEGDFELEVLGADTYILGHRTETVFDSEKLVWEASADPSEVTIENEGDEVDGVSYTVTSVTCEATDGG